MTDEDYARETPGERAARLRASAQETVADVLRALKRAKRDGFDGIPDGAGVRVSLAEISRRAHLDALDSEQHGDTQAQAKRLYADALYVAVLDTGAADAR
jgi:hypothetical protein